MKKFLLAVVAVGLCAGVALAFSADDFIPPVQAKNPEQKAELLAVKDEGGVKKELDANLGLTVTVADNLQDAINSIVAKPRKGCQIARVRGQESNGMEGLTFVATGEGRYFPNYENVIASRIEQRNAYVSAFMDAKTQMVQFLGGIKMNASTTSSKKVDAADTDKNASGGSDSHLTESVGGSAEKELRGYVTYAVHDDGKGKVFVSLASSPTTRGKYQSIADGIVADSLNEGLTLLMNEVKSGVIPLVGGRVISVKGSNEIAFVGFGSCVVRKSSEPDLQAELDLQAERIADLRAMDALTGIIIGDKTRWENHADEDTRKIMRTYQEGQKSDPTASETEQHEKFVREWRNSIKDNPKVVSLREGTLPPGIMRDTEIDENGYFANGIAIMIPSLSDAARQLSREMDDAKILPEPKTPEAEEKAGNSEGEQDTERKSQQELEMRKGPSGVVQQPL